MECAFDKSSKTLVVFQRVRKNEQITTAMAGNADDFLTGGLKQVEAFLSVVHGGKDLSIKLWGNSQVLLSASLSDLLFSAIMDIETNDDLAQMRAVMDDIGAKLAVRKVAQRN